MEIKCQLLKVSSLLQSAANREDFVFNGKHRYPVFTIPLNRLRQFLLNIKVPQCKSIAKEIERENQVKMIAGTFHKLYPYSETQVFMAEKPHVFAIPSSKPCSLASLVLSEAVDDSNTLHRSPRLKMLSIGLKGLRVEVRVGSDCEIVTVAGLSDFNSGSAPLELRHHAWSVRAENYPTSNRPCINVGTLHNPLLLPPELCVVPDYQEMRGTRMPTVSRFVETMRHAYKTKSTIACQSQTGDVIVYTHTKPTEKVKAKRVRQACDGDLSPTLLFLEAGTTAIKSSNWQSLRHVLSDGFHKSLSDSSRVTSYRTTVRLCSEKEFNELNMEALFSSTLSQIRSSPCEFTVLRSGYLVQDGPASGHPHLLVEKDRLKKAHSKKAHGTFAYVTLSEDKLLQLQDQKLALTALKQGQHSMAIVKLSNQLDDSIPAYWIQHLHKKADSTRAIKAAFAIPKASNDEDAQETNNREFVSKLQAEQMQDVNNLLLHRPT